MPGSPTSGALKACTLLSPVSPNEIAGGARGLREDAEEVAGGDQRSRLLHRAEAAARRGHGEASHAGLAMSQISV